MTTAKELALVPPEVELGVRPVVTVQEATAQLAQMREFRAQVLKPGTDYGKIPGIAKPTMFKPGAEKLLNIFGLSVRHEIVDKAEQWDVPFFAYTVRAVVETRDGRVVADCIGSANSREKKYTRQDTYSVVNTLLKMAQKRAMIGAVLIATRASEEYTQDVEDTGTASDEMGDQHAEVPDDLPTRESPWPGPGRMNGKPLTQWSKAGLQWLLLQTKGPNIECWVGLAKDELKARATVPEESAA